MTQNALGKQMAMLLGRLVGDVWEISTIEQSLDPLALHTGPSRNGLLATSLFHLVDALGQKRAGALCTPFQIRSNPQTQSRLASCNPVGPQPRSAVGPGTALTWHTLQTSPRSQPQSAPQ